MYRDMVDAVNGQEFLLDEMLRSPGERHISAQNLAVDDEESACYSDDNWEFEPIRRLRQAA